MSQTLRQLRFPLEVEECESVPGAINRATRQHVLLRPSIVPKEAGVPITHPGLAQLATPAELARIAHVIRCDPMMLLEAAGERVEMASGQSRTFVRFDAMVLPRIFLDLERRRIAPRALETSGHHRTDWLNVLLPYAPETLERLVDRCDHCGAKLGWRYARGIANCDSCPMVVGGSREPDLPSELADDYRDFARLFSLAKGSADERRRLLPRALGGQTSDTLLRLALHLGGLCRDEMLVTSSGLVVADMSPPLRAGVVARGAAMKDWPVGFQGWVDDRAGRLAGDGKGLNDLRRRLLRLIDRNGETSDMIALVSAALPDLQKHAAHRFPLGRRYYLYRETQRRLGLISDQMAEFRKWPELNGRTMPTLRKQHVQFDADQIDQLVPIFRETNSLNSCRERFGIPIYAIEQMCCSGIFEWENHPAILLTKPARQIRVASVADFERRLVQAGRTVKPPKSSVPLSKAVKRFGGRLKPWSAIMSSLARGELTYWLAGPAVPTSMLVRPQDLAAFDHVEAQDCRSDGFVADTMMSQLDAAEALNLLPKQMPAYSIPMSLPFVRRGVALAASRARVLEIAALVAWDVEVSWHLGCRHHDVQRLLSQRGVPEELDGWSRSHLIRLGILPPAEPPP